jgi:chromosome segregation protein
MRLKRVKIFGFKTFAERTEFDLHGNLIAVVGPNGCGKSNLVDAILWGLGEGNARHLRAQSGQDVIFSGSLRRKPVGFAEVSLLFDNEDGSLPVDTSEVSITRRLNRAGESDYFINRQPCRLRDLFDLLADSGLGRSGYAIVGQKEIDQALAASPEDRRAWVDEAAGVQRYRARKLESLKRLSSAQNHLDRIADIVRELDAQREPLREEAEVAIRYKSALGSLRQVESGLLIVDVAKASSEVRDLEQRIAEYCRLGRAELDAADLAEASIRAESETMARVDGDLDRAREQRQANISSVERAQSAIHLAEQKLHTLEELEQSLTDETELLKRRILEAEGEVDALETELDSERARLAKVREDCAGAGDEAKALRDQLRTAESNLAAARETHNRKLRQDAELAQVAERTKAIKRELTGVERTLPDLKRGAAEAESNRETCLAAVKSEEEKVAECSKRLTDLESTVASEAQAARKLLAERAALEGKRQGIESTISAHEGLTHGARAVMEAKKSGVLTADYIPVGEAIEVRKELATAIEVALGGAANDLIVEREEDAKQAIEHLKENRLGRATFQPLTLIRSASSNHEIQKMLGRPEVVGRASELVECKGSFRPVIENLLGRVVVVKDLPAALRLAKSSGWNRLVTLEGEVVHSGGAVTGGLAAKAAYGLVQRKADLTETNVALKRLGSAVAESERKTAGFEKIRLDIQEAIGKARGDLNAAALELTDSKEWLSNIESELNSTERSAQKLRHELGELEAKTPEKILEVDLRGAEGARDAVLALLASRSADADSAAERLRDSEHRSEQATIRLESGRKRLLASRESEKIRERKVLGLGPEREKAKSDKITADLERSRAIALLAQAENTIASLQAERALVQASIASSGEKARSSRSAAQTTTEASHEAELVRARIETRRASLLQRLIEEYSVSEDAALTQAPGIELPADASTVVNRLRRELKAMGDVNLGAVEAFERLTTRWDELTTQSEDVSEGIKQIQASIQELDNLTRERFLDTFDRLKTSFSAVFSRLFDGGEGRLLLRNEQNVLETGVEIDVLLPGKKRQRLELLSGGERSLCATAFLFSLLQVKPSPLVILDEVDAPLDGRNVERFLALLQEFTATSQFIIITHNPTTIESAPVWLGVTMDEPGVSTMIPVRFTPPSIERETAGFV